MPAGLTPDGEKVNYYHFPLHLARTDRFTGDIHQGEIRRLVSLFFRPAACVRPKTRRNTHYPTGTMTRSRLPTIPYLHLLLLSVIAAGVSSLYLSITSRRQNNLLLYSKLFLKARFPLHFSFPEVHLIPPASDRLPFGQPLHHRLDQNGPGDGGVGSRLRRIGRLPFPGQTFPRKFPPGRCSR